MSTERFNSAAATPSTTLVVVPYGIDPLCMQLTGLGFVDMVRSREIGSGVAKLGRLRVKYRVSRYGSHKVELRVCQHGVLQSGWGCKLKQCRGGMNSAIFWENEGMIVQSVAARAGSSDNTCGKSNNTCRVVYQSWFQRSSWGRMNRREASS